MILSLKALLNTSCVLCTLFTLGNGTSLVIFGSSLSDNGNLISLVPETQPDNVSKLYLGGRNSNSYIWHEYIARLLDMDLINCSYTRASVNNSITPVVAYDVQVPSISNQISDFLDKHPVNTNQSCYIQIEIGANDVFDHAGQLLIGILSVSELSKRISASISNDIRRLISAGYRDIIIWNMPPAGRTPVARLFHSEYLAQKTIAQINNELESAMGVFSDSNINLLSLQKIFDLSLDPRILKALNIDNAVDACSPNRIDGGNDKECATPDTYFFFDSFHPSGRFNYLWGVIAAISTCDPRAVSMLTVDSMLSVIEQFDIGNSTRSNNIIANGCHGMCLPNVASDLASYSISHPLAHLPSACRFCQ